MYKVLYLDDSEPILEIGKMFLERDKEIDVVLCNNVVSAYNYLKLNEVNVIIFDYSMPLLNGIQFIDCLRSRDINTPAVLFTAYSNEEVAIDALNAGIEYYLQKSGELKYDFVELKHIIKYVTLKHNESCIINFYEDKYRMIFNISQSPSIILKRDMTFDIVNPAFEELSGYTQDELQKMKWIDFVSPEYLPRMIKYHNDRRDGIKAPNTYDFKFINRNGNKIDVTINVDLIPSTDESIVSFKPKNYK